VQPDDLWQGPVRSDYGLHVVRVSGLTEAYPPALVEVRAEVTTALIAQRRSEANEAEYRKLRDRYEIVVTLPEFAVPAAPAE
jgi:parvulin-like peptidyl-prolyl isomerase